MKEESKYYTPTLEEFHVGFELEIKLHELKPWEKHVWLPGDQASSVEKYLDQVRVKYLDKEDIESLGFIESHYSNINKAFYKFKDYTLHQDRTKVIVFFTANGNNIVKFNGTIKNKSELQQILKMVL